MNKVCAGIVTYNPNIDLLQDNINAIIKQVDSVFVVDNGSNNINELEFAIIEYPTVFLHPNYENLGIAQALNRLCRLAVDKGYCWILTMDQDSICATDMVSCLTTYEDNKYGIIAPRVEFRQDGVLIESTGRKDEEKESELIRACITSGSLTNLQAWKDVGGFDEWYFIDHVDNEFCTHIIQKGYKVIRVNKAVLYQRAGDMKYIRLLGKPIMLPYYSTFRNYYICRNTVYYIRKYWREISLYREIRSFIYSQSIKLIFEKGRWKNVKSSFNGILDGFKKKREYNNYCRTT